MSASGPAPAPVARRFLFDNKPSRSTSTCAAHTSAGTEPHTCRICWGEDDDQPGGRLISPCSCTGTSGHIHLRCLRSWQQSLRSRGMSAAARRCEVCKTLYDDPTLQPAPPFNPTAALHALWKDVRRPQCWPSLALRCYIGYLAVGSVLQSVSTGGAGFMLGMSIGKLLLEQQITYLTSILTCMSHMLGCPLAEIIWINGIGALLAVMLSQIIYTSAIGLLGGMLVGLCTGYVRSLCSSLRFMSSVTGKLVSGATRVMGGLARRLVGVVLAV